MTIIGRVTTPSVATPVMPVSIGSPVIGIVEPPLDLSVEIPVGNVKDLMKKFEPVIEPADVCEAVDMLGIDSSGDDLVCDLAKMAAWIESDSPFPPSAPRDHVRRSKARRKALKKKYDAEDECRCRDPACATPEFGGFPTTESLPSPSLTTTTTHICLCEFIDPCHVVRAWRCCCDRSRSVPLRVVSLGSTRSHWAEDSCTTSIVGGLDLGPHTTGRFPAQDASGIPAQIAPGASHHRDTELLDIRIERGTPSCAPLPLTRLQRRQPSPSWRTTWTCPRRQFSGLVREN